MKDAYVQNSLLEDSYFDSNPYFFPKRCGSRKNMRIKTRANSGNYKNQNSLAKMNNRGNDHYRGGGGRDHGDTRRRMDDDRRHPVVPGFTFVKL